MKRGIFGVVLLILLLTVSTRVDRMAAQQARQVSRLAGQAAQSAMAEDWEKTAALTQRAGAAWRETKKFQALLHHQEPVHDVDVLFAQLRAYERSRDPESCGALCLSLQARTGLLAK